MQRICNLTEEQWAALDAPMPSSWVARPGGAIVGKFKSFCCIMTSNKWFVSAWKDSRRRLYSVLTAERVTSSTIRNFITLRSRAISYRQPSLNNGTINNRLGSTSG
jgi:hypothetical protein